MPIFRDLGNFIKELLSLRSHPNRYQQTKLENHEMRELKLREDLEERYGNLDSFSNLKPAIVKFSSMVGVANFIADCLENDDPGKLASSISDFQFRLENDPDYIVYFLSSIFDQLRFAQKEGFIEKRLSEINLPIDQDHFQFSLPQQRGFQFDIQKHEDGWVLRDIYLVR